jgi:hypothetical protein
VGFIDDGVFVPERIRVHAFMFTPACRSKAIATTQVRQSERRISAARGVAAAEAMPDLNKPGCFIRAVFSSGGPVARI